MQRQEWDVIVAGGGAAGLSAALMLGRSRRRVLVIDAGSPRNRFAAHMHGVLGNEGTPPQELLAKGRDEAAEYGVEFLDATVERAARAVGGIEVFLPDGAVHGARALIVATGVRDVLPDIPGLAERWGHSVLHCPYCHGWEVRGKRLGVLATSPMSLHQVELVRQWSDRLVFFSASLGAVDQETERRLRSRGIEIVPERIVEVAGPGTGISVVRLDDGRDIPIDAVFAAPASNPLDGFASALGLDRSVTPFGSFLSVDASGRTSDERVWAIGNVANPGANVPMSIGAGALTGGAVNGALVGWEFDDAARA